MFSEPFILIPFFLLIFSLCMLIIPPIYRHNKRIREKEEWESTHQVLSEKKIDGITYRVVRDRTPDDGRRLNGKSLQTQEDWDRWWTLKGKGEGYIRRMHEIEEAFYDATQADHEKLLTEWYSRYDSYCALCRQNGMWNEMLKDHVPYIPTDAQRNLEKTLFSNIEKMFLDGKSFRDMYQHYQDAILAYLLTKPGHKVIRKDLFKHFKHDDAEENKQFKKIYNLLVKNHVITDRKNKDGNYYVRKAPKRKEALPPEAEEYSTYNPALYANIDPKMIYKLEYSVSSPIDVDTNHNTCSFISQTSGQRYSTSLSRCSCPMFDPNNRYPCKHMVALAVRLGYLAKERIT